MAIGELVVLEACHSAKLVLFSLDELHALKLRDGDPAASESGPPCIGVGCDRRHAGAAPSSLRLLQ